MIQFMADMTPDDVMNYLDDLNLRGPSPSRAMAAQICTAIAVDVSVSQR